MGCDIHTHVEVRQDDGSWVLVRDLFPVEEWEQEYTKKLTKDEPWDWRSYGVYGFLADVRNYSATPVIAEPRYAIPEDATPEVRADYEEWLGDAHAATWLTMRQLQDYDYDAPMEDRRVTRQIGPNSWDGGATAEPGGGQMTTMRDFLGESFFRDLDIMCELGKLDDVRVVLWFDN